MVEGARSGAAETVDRLIGIAHRKHIGLTAHQQSRQLDLRDVGILKFVDQHKACALLSARQVGCVAPLAQQRDGTGDDVAVGTKIFARQQLLGVTEDARDLATPAQHFLLGHRLGIFGVPHARQRNLLALQLRDISVVVVGRAQFVVATLEETGQALEEFARSGRLDVVLQLQVSDATT